MRRNMQRNMESPGKTWNVEQVKAPKLTYYYDKNGYAVLKWSKVEYAVYIKIYLIQYRNEKI